MPGRQPTAADFPAHLNLAIIPPPASQAPVNVLILLHGLGDTNVSFSNLARQLQLPETTCVSLQGLTPLPFDLGGFHWGDDIIFDQATGQMDFDTGFEKAMKVVREEIIQKALIEKCGYQPREILLFGFGQGAMAALAAASPMKEELAGIISIGGPVPASTVEKMASTPTKNRTPILVLGGSSNTLITAEAIAKLRKVFEFVEHTKWQRNGDGMPRSREEMLPVMQFFSRRLRSRRGVPEGSVELG